MTPLTTDEVRNLVALNVMTGELDPEQAERFEAWARWVREAAWDAGFIAGLCHDPGKTNNESNPYRIEAP